MAISDTQFTQWLNNDSSTRVLLAELSYYGGTKYISDSPFTSKPTDTPANQNYDDCITQTPQFTAQLPDSLEGFTVPTWGNIVAANNDFEKDSWLDEAWNGWPVQLLFGDASWPRADFRPILTGVIDKMTSDVSTVSWAIKDKQWLLNVPIQPNLIGDPTLVTGRTYKVSDTPVTSIDRVWDDGTEVFGFSVNLTAATFTLAADATGKIVCEFTGDNTSQGQVVPLTWGLPFNISPLIINASINKYRYNDGRAKGVLEVREDGIPLDFTANNQEGTFILTNQTGGGEITATVQGLTDSNGIFISDTGRCMLNIMLRRYTTSDINFDSLVNFINKCPQTVGLYCKDRQNMIDVLDKFAHGVGAFYTPGRDGRMLFGRIEDPSLFTGTPAIVLNEDNIVQGGLKIVNQTIPLATVKLSYANNYTVQTKVAGAVSDAEKAILVLPYQVVRRNNDSIKTPYPLSLEPDVKETNFVYYNDCAAETERQLALWGVSRKTYEATSIVAPLTVNLGDIAYITHSRYGLQSGKYLVVIGIVENVISRQVVLKLWG